MATKKKLLQAAAGNAGGAGLDIEEVFNTYVYRGTDTTNTVTNNIDLANEGGIVWFKRRYPGADHSIFMTDLGNTSRIIPNETLALLTGEGGVSSFNSDGFTMNGFLTTNGLNQEMCAWTFRKAPKFFDVVTYTGTGSAQTISHNLGTTVGAIFLKRTDASANWIVYHRGNTSAPHTDFLRLNLTNATQDSGSIWNDTAPTSTEFTVGTSNDVNNSSGTYVAYLFAHNDGDGEFGPDSDQDIIKCGSYTGNGSTTGPSINLGFEPQWIMYKRTDATSNWHMLDTMRGWSYDTSAGDLQLFANLNNAENQDNHSNITPTGFDIISNNSEINASGGEYIYMAIRRGTLNVPEDATKVFDVIEAPSTDALDTKKTTGFPVDFHIYKYTGGSSTITVSRLLGAETRTSVNDGLSMYLDTTQAEGNGGSRGWDSTGFRISNDLQGLETVYWNWKRAPSFFDAVAYTGTGSDLSLQHSLGVVPELAVIKRRNATAGWVVGVPSLSNTAYGFLNDTDDFITSGGNAYFQNTAWSDQYLYLRTDQDVNASGSTYVAYLFASADGVSKVGSFTGPSSGTLTVDCGFTSGSRFVIVKNTSTAGDWFVYDTERGISAGNDPYLKLNNTNAESTTGDFLYNTSSGFVIEAGSTIVGGDTYIFYAIA